MNEWNGIEWNGVGNELTFFLNESVNELRSGLLRFAELSRNDLFVAEKNEWADRMNG